MSHVRGTFGVTATLDRAAAPRIAWKEVLGMTLGVPLCLYLLHSQDPFLLRTEFPWLVLLSLLVGAQHGAAAGAASAALLGAGAWLSGFYIATSAQPAALMAWAAGALATGVISGHFRDRAEARLSALRAQAEDEASRLSRLSRAHAVLKLSHQKLEERLSAQSWSLGAALADATRQMAAQPALSECGRVVLHVLANHAMVQSASLLLRAAGRARDDGQLELTAQSGPPRVPDVRHPLVQRALASGRLVAVDGSGDGAEPSILAAVPLVSAAGRQLGVLVVHEMPFMAFHAAQLRNVAALVAHLSDLLAERGAVPKSENPAEGARRTSSGRGDTRADVLAEAGEGAAAAESDFSGTRTGTRVRPGVARSARA